MGVGTGVDFAGCEAVKEWSAGVGTNQNARRRGQRVCPIRSRKGLGSGGATEQLRPGALRGGLDRTGGERKETGRLRGGEGLLNLYAGGKQKQAQ